MNLISVICRRLHARLVALHANGHAASPPSPMPTVRGPRLRACWLPQPGHTAPRLHWQIDDSQEPPSRWRALACFG